MPHHTHEHSGFAASVLLHSLEEFLGILPFLFLTYLLMEFLEHKAEKKMENAIRRAGKVGPLWGSLLGILPQCGFSAAASGLYAGGVISIGTLLAVFLSTSDEMLPLMIGQVHPLVIVKTLALKFVIAMAAGFVIDAFARLIFKKRKPSLSEHKHEHEHEHEHEHKHGHEHGHEHKHNHAFEIHELCERDDCKCEKGKWWLSALIHTGKTCAFLIVVILLLNTAVYFIGEEHLVEHFTKLPVLGHFAAALIGLIPNCAGSVVITKLYLNGMITAGCMFSGLLVSAGIGVLLLFRMHKSKKKCFAILGLLYGIGVICGMLIDFCGIASLLGL